MISAASIFSTYTGDGATTSFNLAARVYLAADCQAYTYNPGVDIVPQKVLTGVTWVVAGDYSGATATIIPAPAIGVKIGLIRRMDLTQPINISNTNYVPPSVIEQQLDRQVMMAQEAALYSTLPFQSDPFGFTTAARANMAPAFDAAGNQTFVNDIFPVMGNWSSVINYTYRQVVARNGVSYICLTSNNLNHDPATDGGTNWQTLSSPGQITSVAGLTGTIASPDLRNATATTPHVISIAALQALDTTKDTVAYLNALGREGTFTWNGANLSAAVAGDIDQYYYVPPTADTTGASGAWVRAGAGKTVGVYSPTGTEGVAANSLISAFTSDLTSTERYTHFIANYDSGTGDGTVPASTYGLGISSLKDSWQTTTRRGQMHGLSIVTRGGYNGADPGLPDYNYGDTVAIVSNSVVSSGQSFTAMFEGVSYYGPAGNVTDATAKGIRVQIGAIRANDNPGIGLVVNAIQGGLGAAIQVQNTTPASWAYGFRYLFDAGAGAVERFSIQQQGAIKLKGALAGSLTKQIRASVSVDGDLEILNDAGSAVVAAIKDVGSMALGAGATSGGYAGFATSLLVQSTAASGMELASSRADANNVDIGAVEGNARIATATHDRIAGIVYRTDGTTANKRGGRIVFQTKTDNVAGLVDRIVLTQAAQFLPVTDNSVNLGQNGFAWSLVNSKLYQVDANQVVGARSTGWTAMTGTADKSTAFATSAVTLAQLASRVLSLQAALTTHGLIGA